MQPMKLSKSSKATEFMQKSTVVCGVAVTSMALLLAGCSSGLGSSASSTSTLVQARPAAKGLVHGGQQPVVAATIQLYEVGTTGNASAAKALLTGAPVLTDANGGFYIAALPACDTPNSTVYLTATGGNAVAGQPSNTGLAMMVGLGNCTTLIANAASMFINMNEVTTVASVFALSSFTSDYANVGYASANLSGITDAFAVQNLLASTGSGSAPGYTPASGITLPSTKLYSLADSISACINSPGATSIGCSALFTAATPSGGSAPADTIAALANIAHNPSLNVSTIYALSPTTPPFQPTLTVAPADWTMPIVYTGGGLSLPTGVAIDATGNAWIANQGGNDITEISNGTFASGTSGYSSAAIVGPQSVAIDNAGTVWVANTGADNVLGLNASGAVTSTLSTGVSGPVSVAIDGSGDVWVANFDGNSLAEFTSGGSVASGSPFTNAALSGPTGLAIDASNNVWVGNSVPGNVALFNNSGAFQATYTDGLLVAPGGVATDSVHGRVWAAATGINALTGLTSGGATVTGGPFVGGGVSQPLSVAVDGSGTVWTVGSAATGSVSAFTSNGAAITPTAGLGSLNMPVNLALDAAGNLWTIDAGDNSVTEFVGLASATVTPLVASPR